MAKIMYCIGKLKGGNREMIVSEDSIKSNTDDIRNTPAKRVNIVSIKMVREASILYGCRKISNPYDAAELGKKFLEESDREQLILCCLDTKNQPIAINTVSIGSLNSSIVHPREVFKAAILSNAASIILFHNHPSGDPIPSSEDKNITERIKECGKLLGISLLDHIVIGNDSYCSLKEEGII